MNALPKTFFVIPNKFNIDSSFEISSELNRIGIKHDTLGPLNKSAFFIVDSGKYKTISQDDFISVFTTYSISANRAPVFTHDYFMELVKSIEINDNEIYVIDRWKCDVIKIKKPEYDVKKHIVIGEDVDRILIAKGSHGYGYVYLKRDKKGDYGLFNKATGEIDTSINYLNQFKILWTRPVNEAENTSFDDSEWPSLKDFEYVFKDAEKHIEKINEAFKIVKDIDSKIGPAGKELIARLISSFGKL